MLSAARVQATIEILDEILEGDDAAEVVITRWFRSHRFAGSKDRAAVRDHIYDALRNLRSYAARGGGMWGRAVMIGALLGKDTDLSLVFSGKGYGPSELDTQEIGPFPEASIQERFDIPDWLWPIWCTDLADQAQDIAEKLTHRAPVFLRVNLIKSSVRHVIEILEKDGIKAIAHDTVPTALLVLENARWILNSNTYLEGLVELQDASSQMSICNLPIHIDGEILDYCAGGGGKSLALAAWLKCKVFAHDTAPLRMKDLPSRAMRAGADVECISEDELYNDSYGLVFCDVPCSGSGAWRRDPWGKWVLTEETLVAVIQTQAQILRQAFEYVKPGGLLVYATCSVLQRENILQVDCVTSSHASLECLESNQIMPSETGDGFFYSYMRKDK
ncbi:MAG: RsmB/NOP family class I SAM-dependent RNA methyltransferase [Paracoccaceae bacterium]|nr:RsmB/NOP family class I SAM-dependent RNA methyltransferase [Paracoccaceae bacterium]